LRSGVLRRSIVLAIVIGATLVGASVADAARYIVLYNGRSVPASAERAIAEAGGTLVYSYDRIGVAIADSTDPAFLARLDGRKGVAAVAPSGDDDFDEALVSNPSEPRMGLLPNEPATDNDTFSSRQWNLRQIGATDAHAITGGSPSVLVGHLDSGVDYTHPDLLHNVDLANSASCVGGVPNQQPDASGRHPFFDTNGHGTFTAGEIVADDNGIGIVGVAPNVRLATVKVTSVDARDGRTKIFPESAICGLMWAATHGFDVMNSSLAIDRTELNLPAARVGYYCRSNPEDAVVIKAVRRATRYALRRGVSLVASAGNTNVDLTNPPAGEDCIRLPGGLPGVIAVSAVGPVRADGSVQRKTFSSNYGLGAIDLTAPGGDQFELTPVTAGLVFSTLPNNTYGFMGGSTSAAAPHVTGVAALVISMFGDSSPGNGRMKPSRLRAILEESATELACPPNPYIRPTVAPAFCEGTDELNGFYGHGEINALAALGG
jgi:lantibiotic leader peptide-processing serine protease